VYETQGTTLLFQARAYAEIGDELVRSVAAKKGGRLHMWEHAYYLQYQNVKGDWVTAFWKLVHWEDVAQRFQKVRTLDLAL